ncbi:MAG: hypothetical protein DWQ07_20160 [Chloroflexi bacterium]|nr:MAG: hypothetical protein DWQ07_20160 [Chloroflexota bacterium]MBL1194396.1 hypothetical protein [Chloroflexota bacterium]NOH11684.1 hypothetical protein [Chloroflexota bacterium]
MNLHKYNSLERGQGLIEYVILLALVAVVTVGAVAVTGEGTADLMEGIVDTIGNGPQDEEGPIDLEGEQSFSVNVTLVDQNGFLIPNVPVLAFDGDGNYLDLQQETSTNGQSIFTNLEPGTFAFRADYRAREFWSTVVGGPPSAEVEIRVENTGFAVFVVNASGNPIQDVTVAAFNEVDGDYAGIKGKSDAAGIASIKDLATGSYAFRADYRGQIFWSEVVDTSKTGNTSITINVSQAIVSVSDREGASLSGVPVYAYTENEEYTGVSGRSGSDGSIMLDLPEGNYKFRADYDGHAYWTEMNKVSGESKVAMQVGPYSVSVDVFNQQGKGLNRVNVIAYNRANNQPMFQMLTNKKGNLSASLPPGDYYLRVFYDEQEYNPPDFSVPATTEVRVELELAADKGDLVVQVKGKKNSRIADTYVLLYRHTGRYYSFIEWKYSDENGEAVFDDLDEGKYLVYVYDWNSYRWRWKYVNVPRNNPVKINVN